MLPDARLNSHLGSSATSLVSVYERRLFSASAHWPYEILHQILLAACARVTRAYGFLSDGQLSDHKPRPFKLDAYLLS